MANANASATVRQITLPPKPGVILTTSEYGALHNKSIPVVKRAIAQGRLPIRRVGGGPRRVTSVLILTDEPLVALRSGDLSVDQRRAWNRGRK